MPRCSAVVRCKVEGCRWSAKHSADEPVEIVEFLDKTRRQHYAEKHPEQVAHVSESITMEQRGDQA